MADLNNYEEILARFLSTDSDPQDESLLNDAVLVFILETVRRHAERVNAGIEATAHEKASMVIAARLMAPPDLPKQWRVSFPQVWLPGSGKADLTKFRDYSLGASVAGHVRNGMTIGGAQKAASDEHCVSIDKARQAWKAIPKAERPEKMGKKSPKK